MANDNNLTDLEKAQQAFNLTEGTKVATQANTVQTTAAQQWTPEMVKFLTVSVLVFTFAALLLSAILLWKKGTTAGQLLKLFGIITIIGVTAVLLIVGYSNEQLTPIIGLFGAIAGYLLGKDVSDDKHDK